MILVTAAYGNQGQRLIPLLASAGKQVRAMRRSGDLESLKALGATEAIRGDASDPADLARAMQNIETVYHIAPSLHPCEQEMGLAVVDAAESEGVRHLVFSSVLHAIESELIQHRAKLAIEQRIIKSSINWTILQPTNYMLPAWSTPVFETEVFRLWWSLDKRQSLIILDDYAEAAAKVIMEGSKHYGATYELSSADCLTAHEIADRFAEITGKPIKAEEVPAAEFFIKCRKHPLVEAKLAVGEAVTAEHFPANSKCSRRSARATRNMTSSATPTCSPGCWTGNLPRSNSICGGNTPRSCRLPSGKPDGKVPSR